MSSFSKFIEVIKSRVSRMENELLSYEIIVNVKSKAGGIHPIFDLHFFKISLLVFFVLCSSVFFYFTAWLPPESFPTYSISTVEKGGSLHDISEQLKSENAIRSAFWLKIVVTLKGGQKKIFAGDYYFSKPQTVFGIARRLTSGEFGLTPRRVFIPEGLNSFEIAEVLSQSLIKFDKQEFIAKAKENEGYLFPDTYFLMPNEKPDTIIGMMRENFIRNVESLEPDIEKFGKPFLDVLIMASIIEDEVKTVEDKRIVAGILWKRLKLKMPLQVDAAFKYYNGKTTFDLTKDDLQDQDNPYNTYVNKGLPPTPISNPGLDALRAAVAPTNTKYLYFLSDRFGQMHYATNFAAHKKNRELYLR
ncbi:MAG: endolytic transglycosylase MltG [Patescibacteria group bacterium]